MLSNDKLLSFECQVCRNVFQDMRKSVNVPRKWCKDCRQEGARLYRRDKRRAAGHAEIGASETCQHCGDVFIRQHRRQFYCASCSELSAKSALPDARRVQNEYQKARNKRRRTENPAVAIRERMSAGVRNSLRDGKGGRSWEALAGYTVTELMTHLERQFLPGMTWGNRGEWHIDHIVPLASFNFSSPEDLEFRAAWALTNLRPLWAKDNIRKSAKRTHLI